MIEKGIPIPEAANGRRGTSVFAQMEIGDSVLMGKGYTQPQALSAALYQAKKIGNGVKFTTRKMEDGRIRVWRIA